MNLVKIIYFDEDSALDFLDLQEGGRYYFSEDNVKKYHNSVGVKGNAEVKAGSKIPFLNLLFSVKTDASISGEGNKLIQSTLSHTVLTDFISKVEGINGNDEENIHMVHVFNNTKVEIIKESYAYYKVITPFTKIMEEKVIKTDEANIDLTEVDEMLENAKGYYELLAKRNGKKFVLRFNSKSFRNNYRLFDLEKMDLSYFGVKIGKCLRDELLLENQLPKDVRNNSSIQNNSKHEGIIDAYDHYDMDHAIDSQNEQKHEHQESDKLLEEEYLEIFDVILAGVEDA